MTQKSAPPRLITLIFLSALAVLPVNMILPSLPDIADTFNAQYWLVYLSVAAYASIDALAQLFSGALSARYGRRTVALAAIAVFVIASIGCALAANIGMFLAFRAMQASIGICYSVSLAIIRDTYGEREAASKIGYVAMAWATAPLLGPTFGGLLSDLFGWQSNFVALAMIGAALFVLSAFDLRELTNHTSRPIARYLSDYGKVLRSQRFLSYTLCMIFSIGTLYIFLGGAPAVGKSLSVSNAQLGFYMGMVPAGFIFGSYLAGSYASRYSVATIVIVGRLSTCAGLMVGLILLLSGLTHVLSFFGPCMFIGIGNGLSMAGANASVLSVHADRPDIAAGLAPALTTAGGAIMTSICGLFITQENAVHVLPSLMLASALLALLAALYASAIDRRSSE